MNNRNRAILIILIVILVMSGIFFSIFLFEFKQSFNERVARHEDSLERLVESEFKRMSNTYVNRITGFIKSNTNAIHSFENKNQNELIKYITPRFNTLKSENPDFYDICFYDTDGKLFLSMRNQEKFGINLSEQQFIKTLNTETDSLHGFTMSDNRLFFQVASNVYSKNKKIGIIEFKISTNNMNTVIQKVLQYDYAIAMTQDTTLADVKHHPMVKVIEASCTLFTNLPITFDYDKPHHEISLGDSDFLLNINQIYDFEGGQIGYFMTALDITEMKQRLDSLLLYTFIITIVMIIISTTTLSIGFGSLLRKIETMNLDLEQKINIRTKELEEIKNNALEQNRVIGSLYKRFKSMFQDHHSIMMLINPENGNIIDANKAAALFFGMSRKDIMKLNVSDVSLLPNEDIEKVLARSMEEGLKNYVSKFKLGNDIYDLELQASPIEMDGITLLFVICYNVTQKIEIENQMKEINQNLENMVLDEAEKRRKQELLLIQQSKMSSVGEILSAIIHQWKQPITAVSYLMQDIHDASERNMIDQKYLMSVAEEALKQINYMNETVEDFRRFLMPSTKKESFNTAHDVIAVIKMLHKQIEKDNIDLRITVVNRETDSTTFNSSEIPENDSFDFSTECFNSFGYPNEFKQVLMNIINNARDALNEAHHGDIPRINIVVSCSGDIIEVSVSDNAGGIPASIIEKVFEPYFTTKTTKGTGIGLYMAKTIIEEHMSGSISVANNEYGALFTITLKSCKEV